MSVQDAIVFGFENKSWLGNQHGKHTSNIQKHFLCLATGKNLGCFFSGSMSCCSGHWNNVVATKDKWKKKKKKPSAFKQQHEFRLKAPVWGPVWLGWVPAGYWPREGRAGGPLRFSVLVSSSPHTAARDLQHFLLWEGWELIVFMRRTWPRKAFSTICLCTWQSPRCSFPPERVWAPVHRRHASLPGEQQQLLGPESPQLLAFMSTSAVREIYFYRK